MDISSAIARIVEILEDVGISDPVSLQMKRVYDFPPSRANNLTSTPCAMIEWSLQNEDRLVDFRRQFYNVHIQVFVNEASNNRAAQIASAFMPAIVDAFDADITLDGNVTETTLTGNTPTLASLEWNSRTYVGLDFNLTLLMAEAKGFS